MSWLDRSARFAAAAAVAGLALGGCTPLRPLYADPALSAAVLPGGVDVGRELSRIEIVELTSRVGIQVRNDLIFLLNGGGAETRDPAYRLEMSVSSSAAFYAVQPGTGLARTAAVTVGVTYSLVRLADQRRVFVSSAVSRANFDRGVQRFANIRAERDAEDRAAREAAEQIRAGVAAFLAQGPAARS
jgi:LPS-assembly lipoprotein